ncbi:Serine/threonine-protein kinase D [Burkholderiaceae bacterium]|nr:Serine/threonine-protein kinase D [Burkholderiaceae bacterium]
MNETAAATAPDDLGSPLPDGTVLHEFTLERVLGVGGFGIVYLARDSQLQRTVALKEYMPSSLASRPTGLSVAVRSERHRETFELGRRSFVNEARLLASFDHPSLVKVYRFWEQNDTAYMVMPYYEGPTLKNWLKQQREPPDEAWFKRLLAPLLDALELIHADRCYHRDIAPDNIILLGTQHRPVLLDFGAARRVIGDATQALTTILKPGYAPIEQYAEVPSMKQGAWTDVYALSAVLYAALTGRPPMTAVGRMMNDEMVPVSSTAAGRYSKEFLKAIDAGLALRPEHRPQSIGDLRELLFAPPGRNDDEATVLHLPADDERTVLKQQTTTPLVRPRVDDATVIDMRGGAQQAAPVRADLPREAPAPAPVNEASAKASNAPPPVAAAPSTNKAGPVLIAGMAGLAAITAAVWFFTDGSSGTPPVDPKPIASTGGASTEANTRTDPNAADAAPVTAQQAAAARPVFSTVAVLDDIVRHADPRIAVQAAPDKASLVIGRDRMAFRVKASEPGYLYVFLSGTDQQHLSLLFPNALDTDNRIEANADVVLPRKGWQISAGGPVGTNHLVTMVSRQPRDFGGAGLRMGETIPEFDLPALRQAWGGAGVAPGAGEAQCAQGSQGCDGRYGATLIRIEEVGAR